MGSKKVVIFFALTFLLISKDAPCKKNPIYESISQSVAAIGIEDSNGVWTPIGT